MWTHARQPGHPPRGGARRTPLPTPAYRSSRRQARISSRISPHAREWSCRLREERAHPAAGACCLGTLRLAHPQRTSRSARLPRAPHAPALTSNRHAAALHGGRRSGFVRGVSLTWCAYICAAMRLSAGVYMSWCSVRPGCGAAPRNGHASGPFISRNIFRDVLVMSCITRAMPGTRVPLMRSAPRSTWNTAMEKLRIVRLGFGTS